MKDMEKDLKQTLGVDENKPIPADFNIPYFVHQDDMNRLDMSHKRVEKWIIGFAIIIFIALVGTNIGWMVYENSFVDEITVTQDTPHGNNNYIGRDGDITNGSTNDN